MVGEAIAGLSAFKTMFDMAKALQNIHDTALRDRAVIDLQKEILAAQVTQATLIERVGDLEKQVASFEKWDAEKEKYELKEIYPQNFAYAIKENARGSEPPHLICATCYENRKKTIPQKSDAVHLTCPVCKTRVQFKASQPLQVRTSRGSEYF
jgi:CRISPR/Cas system-associated protein Cas5 (RAMP superfamily)